MVRYYFPDRSPLGQRFDFNIPFRGPGIEIVGVVRDARYNNLKERTALMAYLPAAQEPDALKSLEVRTAPGTASAVAAQMRNAISEVDRNLPVHTITTIAQQVDRSLTQERATTTLTALFGLLAL